VHGGKADQAAAAFERLQAAYAKEGKADEFAAQMDNYQAALEGARFEQELAAASMGLFGEQAIQVQEKLAAQQASADGLRQSLQALNEVNRQGLGGMIGFEAAIDAAAEAAEKYSGELDMHNGKLTVGTENQRAAAQALTDLAAKTDEATAAARESGASWGEVNGIYERGRQQLIANAQQMGLNRDQAKALADQILATPDRTAKLQGDVADLEEKVARAKERLKSVPPSKQSKIQADISQLEYQAHRARQELALIKSKTVVITTHYRITGGQARREGVHGTQLAYSTGGYVYGPGTSTSDSIDARLSNGEYVLRAAAVDRVGREFLDRLNQGALPAAKPAAGLPAPVASVSSAVGTSSQVTYNVYPRKSVIDAQDLRLMQREEEARQRVGRPR
jgi:hypothetical protein